MAKLSSAQRRVLEAMRDGARLLFNKDCAWLVDKHGLVRDPGKGIVLALQRQGLVGMSDVEYWAYTLTPLGRKTLEAGE